MKKYGQHTTNKYDDYLSSYEYDELIIEKNWNGKLQELKNFCFNNKSRHDINRKIKKIIKSRC